MDLLQARPASDSDNGDDQFLLAVWRMASCVLVRQIDSWDKGQGFATSDPIELWNYGVALRNWLQMGRLYDDTWGEGADDSSRRTTEDATRHLENRLVSFVRQEFVGRRLVFSAAGAWRILGHWGPVEGWNADQINAFISVLDTLNAYRMTDISSELGLSERYHGMAQSIGMLSSEQLAERLGIYMAALQVSLGATQTAHSVKVRAGLGRIASDILEHMVARSPRFSPHDLLVEARLRLRRERREKFPMAESFYCQDAMRAYEEMLRGWAAWLS